MKDKLLNTIKTNELLEFYGAFLTKKQLLIMQDYYVYNLSFTEISENRKITKTAVSDTIAKSIKKLENCEEKLQLLKIFSELESNKKDIETVLQIKEKIKNGI